MATGVVYATAVLRRLYKFQYMNGGHRMREFWEHSEAGSGLRGGSW